MRSLLLAFVCLFSIQSALAQEETKVKEEKVITKRFYLQYRRSTGNRHLFDAKAINAFGIGFGIDYKLSKVLFLKSDVVINQKGYISSFSNTDIYGNEYGVSSNKITDYCFDVPLLLGIKIVQYEKIDFNIYSGLILSTSFGYSYLGLNSNYGHIYRVTKFGDVHISPGICLGMAFATKINSTNKLVISPFYEYIIYEKLKYNNLHLTREALGVSIGISF